MCHALLQDPRFSALLLRIDQELAARTHAAGCACSGRLHRANYPRKPRGCLAEFRAIFDQRFSFCCAICRKRTTAESVRFLGRRVYLALVVVLASLAIPARTLERWRGWWRDTFTQSGLWQSACSAFMPPLTTDVLPDALLERFLGADPAARMIGLLRFLAPLTVAAPSLQPSP